MHAFIFASFVHLCLQTMLPLSWQRTIPKNVSPLSSTCSLAVRTFSQWLLGNNDKQSIFWKLLWKNFWNFNLRHSHEKWKINFFKKYYQKRYYSHHKNFKIPFCGLCLRQCRQGNYCFYDLLFDCEEFFTFFKFENVY